MACSTRVALVCLSSVLLAGACDDGPAVGSTTEGIASDSGETDGGETDGIETEGVETDGWQPWEDCPEGYAAVQYEDECEPDEHCFEWGGGWCTGRCPEGTDLWFDVGAVCMEASCGDDEIYRPAGEGCSEGPGVECPSGGWGGHGGWSCETCAFGWYADEEASTEEGLNCIEGCAEGYELIYGEDECLADAGCYALPQRNGLDNGWCTGACPEGRELTMPAGELPTCAPAE